MTVSIINPHDDARFEIQRDVNNGSLLVLVEMSRPVKWYHMSRDQTIGMAMAMLEAAGIPIDETYRRQLAFKKGVTQ